MANWKPFTKNSKHYYTGPNFGYSQLNKYYVRFEYDDDYNTPEKVKCRVVCDNDVWGNGYGTDYLFLWTPNDYIELVNGKKTQNFMIHNGDSREIPLVTPAFYMTKNWNDAGFTFPQFWICHQGRQGQNGPATFDPTLFKKGGDREKYVTKVTSTNLPFYNGYTPPSLKDSVGTLRIEDHGNNEYTISGTLPPDLPQNNPSYRYPNKVKRMELTWSTNINGDRVLYTQLKEAGSSELKNGKFSYTCITPYNDTNDIIDIEANLSITGTYDNPYDLDATKTAYFYGHPYSTQYDGHSIDYDTPNPTTISVFTMNWEGLFIPLNSNSPIRSYKCEIQKKTDEYTYETLLTKELSSNITTLSFTSTHNTYNNTLDKVDIKVGDTIRVLVYGYTRDSNNNISIIGTYSMPIITEDLTIESNGVVKLNVGNNKFVEGQPYVMTVDGWKESLEVYTFTTEGWKKSIR